LKNNYMEVKFMMGATKTAATGLGLGLAFTVGVAFAETPAPGTPAGREEAQRLAQEPPVPVEHGGKQGLDHSGRKMKGVASFYSRQFAHRRMADGNRFSVHSNAAASKILPIGTTARVTNVENGQSATVKVEDRGPFVDGRVIDLSPVTAGAIGITRKKGIAPVVVAPIEVPQPDGSVKAGAGYAEVAEDPGNRRR
jgi:rare lipoprotein A